MSQFGWLRMTLGAAPEGAAIWPERGVFTEQGMSARQTTARQLHATDEAGVPGLHVSTRFGLWGTKGTPRAVVTEALADPALRMRFADLGQEIFPREQQTPEALAAFHKAEIEKWWPIIKAAGIKAE